jgi:uncharacterized protein (DUF1800 family)
MCACIHSYQGKTMSGFLGKMFGSQQMQSAMPRMFDYMQNGRQQPQMPRQPVQNMGALDQNAYQPPNGFAGLQTMFGMPNGFGQRQQPTFGRQPVQSANYANPPQVGAYSQGMNWGGGSPTFDESNGRRSAWGGW